MKKLISLLLLSCLFVTAAVPAVQPITRASTAMDRQAMQLVVGGDQEFWCEFAFYSMGVWTEVALGLAAVSFGWSLAVGAVIFVSTSLIC